MIHVLSTLGDQVQIIQGAHSNLWTNHVSTETSTWIYQALCHERDKGSALLSMGISDAMALLAADVVVGDISSIAIEAALLEKAILLNIDENSFRNKQIYEIYKIMSVQFEGAEDLLQKFIHGVNFPRKERTLFAKPKRCLASISAMRQAKSHRSFSKQHINAIESHSHQESARDALITQRATQKKQDTATSKPKPIARNTHLYVTQ